MSSMDFKPGWCSHCQNTGYIDCHCGGDLCICENNGEEPCPFCDGVTDDIDEGFDAGEWNNPPAPEPPK